jgi:hypothetical protein
MLDTNDSLIQLANNIPWLKFEKEFQKRDKRVTNIVTIF